MTLSNFDYLYEMDKGTLGQSDIEALQRELKENDLTCVPYPEEMIMDADIEWEE